MNKLLQNLGVLFVGLFCSLYLLNPGAGFVEIISDFVPFFGNFDEAAAVLLLLRCLSHFGIDLSFLTKLRKSAAEPPPRAPERPQPEPARRTREKVIDV